jgi:heme/copper-type cytochrome/quinol oxidase subunit 2
MKDNAGYKRLIMAPFNPLIEAILILLVISPLLVFWVWMFRDMLNSDNLPNLMSNDAKTDWTLIFIILNVFAAAIYYSRVYRNRR